MRAAICGCYYCLATFPSGDIHEWRDDSQTAVCPRCGIDSVLPDEIDVATRQALHHDRFEVAYRLDAIGTRERAAGD
jgi:hypothetical protein